MQLVVIFSSRVKRRRVEASRSPGCYRRPVTAVVSDADQRAESAAPVSTRISRRWWDLAVAVLASAAAVWMVHGIWADPVRRTIGNNSGDHMFFEWLLGYGVFALTHGADPFFAQELNAPYGVNLAVNTSITAYALLFAPVTHLLGPSVSFVLILTLNLAGAAFAWYWLLSRHVVRHPAAAAVAGMFAGFAPGFVSHANGHLNWSAGWVPAVIVLRVLKLREPGRAVRNGLLLGVLIAVCFTVAAEGLFFTALACGVFCGTWALLPATRAEARAALPVFLGGLGIAAGTAAVLLAYPLWMHFAGPPSFKGTGFSQRWHAEDITAYVSWSARSLAGRFGYARDVAPNPTEETSFFGVPLVLLVLLCLVALFRRSSPGRRATLLALTVCLVVFTVLSFGPRAKLNGTVTGVPLPYAGLAHLPLFDSALPARIALVVAGVIAVILAFGLDDLVAGRVRRATRTAWIAGFTAALLPLVPTPLPAPTRAPIPHFVSSGRWKQYVPPGGALTSVPLASDHHPDGQRWQAVVMAQGGRVFEIPGGYFLGPGRADRKGRIGAPETDTSWWLEQAARYGRGLNVSDWQRGNIVRDMRIWGVSAVILPDQLSGAFHPVHHDTVLQVTTLLLGPPQRVDDVWLWQVDPGR